MNGAPGLVATLVSPHGQEPASAVALLLVKVERSVKATL